MRPYHPDGRLLLIEILSKLLLLLTTLDIHQDIDGNSLDLNGICNINNLTPLCINQSIMVEIAQVEAVYDMLKEQSTIKWSVAGLSTAYFRLATLISETVRNFTY